MPTQAAFPSIAGRSLSSDGPPLCPIPLIIALSEPKRDAKGLIGPVTRKRIGDDLCDYIGIGCACPFCPAPKLGGKLVIISSNMAVSDKPTNLTGRDLGAGGNGQR